MEDVVNNLPVIKYISFKVSVENDSFENMVEIVKMSQMQNLLGKCALMMYK